MGRAALKSELSPKAPIRHGRRKGRPPPEDRALPMEGRHSYRYRPRRDDFMILVSATRIRPATLAYLMSEGLIAVVGLRAIRPAEPN